MQAITFGYTSLRFTHFDPKLRNDVYNRFPKALQDHANYPLPIDTPDEERVRVLQESSGATELQIGDKIDFTPQDLGAAVELLAASDVTSFTVSYKK